MTFYSRAVSWLMGLLSRKPEIAPAETTTVGADFEAAVGATPVYDPETALSSFAAFPAMFAAVERRCEDLSGIPVYVAKDKEGKSRIDNHPAAMLFEMPNSSQTGVEFWRQVFADCDLVREVFVLKMRDRSGNVVSLVRVHPKRMEPIPSPLGLVAGYRNTSTGQEYPVEDVLHVRGISWQDNPDNLRPASPVLALDSTLTAEKEVRDFTGRAAKVGRPSVVISPLHDSMTWNEDQARQIADEYAERVRHGGALVNRFGSKIDHVSTTPADLQALETRKANREDVGMTICAPPVVMGMPGSNYAESEIQELRYWISLRSRAELFAAALTRLAREMTGERVYFGFDFSGVPALQRTRNSQLERVAQLVDLGAHPDEAAAFEGLADAPLPHERPVPATPPGLGTPAPGADSPDEPPEDDDLGEPGDGTGGTSRPSRSDSFDEWYTRGVREERLDTRQAWTAWARDVQEPFQARLEARLRVFFAEQAQRLAASLPEPERAATDEAFDYEAEVDLLATALQDILDDALAAGFSRESVLLGIEGLSFDTQGDIAARLASDASRLITTTTAAKVQGIIDSGLQDGQTIQEIRGRIEQDPAFGPARALTVARTESAHAVNVGQTNAQQQAAAQGLDFEVVWLASPNSGDFERRHDALDGEAVEPGSNFVNPITGREAPGPSQFGSAREDANCRCTTYSRRRRRQDPQ